jgi:hypothetical protein
MYGKLQYKSKKDLAVNIEYYNLKEIQGQGTLALKNFSLYKFYAGIPVNKFINSSKTLHFQMAANYELTKRNSSESIENIDLKTMQLSAGLRWEFVTDFELLLGYVSQDNSGNEFLSDRNSYADITYYNLVKYKTNQQIAAAGFRFNFTPKIYLCALYQNINYKDKQHNYADFAIGQFGLIFNMTF